MTKKRFNFFLAKKGKKYKNHHTLPQIKKKLFRTMVPIFSLFIEPHSRRPLKPQRTTDPLPKKVVLIKNECT